MTELVKTIVETEKGINAERFKNLDDLWVDLDVESEETED